MRSSYSTFKYPFPASHTINKERMKNLVEKYWKLNRTAVNPDTDKLVSYLCKHLNAKVIEVRSGKECFTWRIPKHWNVRKGQLRKKDGTVIADFADNPLYLWSHSISFQGEVSKDELIKHIYTDPNRPDEIPYHYFNAYRYDAEEWGFSLPYRMVQQLLLNEEVDEVYSVDIDTDLDNEGTLKVVDAFLKGKYEDTFFIMAHTCHPAQVSDGIANIAIAVELYHHLNSYQERKFSYRFLFAPEYFGAIAYLTHAPKKDIKNLRFGIYLDMLSNHEPLGFQYSMQGNSLIDKIVRNVIKSHTEIYIERPFRELWGNDEIFYNDFLIPVVGIARGMYREYHYSSDNLDNMDVYHMVESVWILMRIVEVLETDFIPIRNYSAPLYLSRYNLNADSEVMKNLYKIQAMINGENSCMDIADELNIDYFCLRDFLNKLIEMDLVRKHPRTLRKSDQGTLYKNER